MSTASSAWPAGPPDHLLDLAEWEALPEDTSARFELVEGVMVVSPRPSYRHQDLVHRLCGQLRDQLSEDLTALPEVDLVVDDGAGRGPATVRVPDVVVVPSTHVEDHARGGRGEVMAAIEVLSPGSRRTDRVAKLAEYAEAGIPHYVVVDPGARSRSTSSPTRALLRATHSSVRGPVRPGWPSDRGSHCPLRGNAASAVCCERPRPRRDLDRGILSVILPTVATCR